MVKFIGDNGASALDNGKKITKDNLVFEVLGDLDELTSFLGFAKNFIKNVTFKNWVTDVQKDIFVLLSELAGAQKANWEKIIKKLDEKLEFCQKNIPDLKNFIIPGASVASACLDCSRAVCRRAERSLIRLNKVKKIDPEIIVYLNHLSKFLFFFARLVNKKLRIKEDVI
ncbi:MAG TPA: cob(I)yrinic acid a,c-diamide adenosyltransferase [Candidatus Paceibacterota bacterium]|nr:cob(I)yrinic acid a,c-diamide adenosyltransferase [Candidatus Paceibacterota bacterium]